MHTGRIATPSQAWRTRATALLLAGASLASACSTQTLNDTGDAAPKSGTPNPFVATSPGSEELYVPEFRIDPSLSVHGEGIEVLGMEGGDSPMAVESNTLVVVGERTASLDEFVARHGATVIEETDAYVRVRIEPTESDVRLAPARIATSLGLTVGADEAPIASNPGVVGLLGLAALAQQRGLPATLNMEIQSSANDIVLSGSATEQWTWDGSDDPFTWDYMIDGSIQDFGVTEAWRLLDSVGKLEPHSASIAVLDQGFFTADHPDLADATVFPAGLSGRSAPNCSDGPDCQQHGSLVATVAAGKLSNQRGSAGTGAPVADLHLIDNRGSGGPRIFITSTISALSEAAQLRPDILNISWSGSAPWYTAWIVDPISSMITDDFDDRGTLVVASAGNDGKNVDAEASCGFLGGCGFEREVIYPCELSDVLCVGGLDRNSLEPHQDSNYGSEDVDLWGPFVHAGPNGTIAGTSFAAPFVSGIAALLAAARPDASPGTIRRILDNTAHHVDGRSVVDAAQIAFEQAYGFQRDRDIDEIGIRVIGNRLTSIEVAATINGRTEQWHGLNQQVFFDDLRPNFERMEWLVDGKFAGYGSNARIDTPRPGAYRIDLRFVRFNGEVMHAETVVLQEERRPRIDIIGTPDVDLVAGQLLELEVEYFDVWDADPSIHWKLNGNLWESPSISEVIGGRRATVRLDTAELLPGQHAFTIEVSTGRGAFATVEHQFVVTKPEQIAANDTVPVLQIRSVDEEVLEPGRRGVFIGLIAEDAEDGDLREDVEFELRCEDGRTVPFEVGFEDGAWTTELETVGLDECPKYRVKRGYGYVIIATLTDSDGNSATDQDELVLEGFVR